VNGSDFNNPSLIEQRKKLLSNINDLVENLNENNRALKEASKKNNKPLLK
jgi:hypothetical protein